MQLYLASSRNGARRGYVLLMTMVIAGAIGLAICAYLNIINTQNNLTVRSQMWNLCMPVTEAGLEEGMSHINNPGATNYATLGWSWNATSQAFEITRVVGDSYYTAAIKTNAAAGPIITCTGYVPAPVTIATPGDRILASAVPVPGVSYIARTVQLTTRRDPLLAKAMTVKNDINFNGNTVLIDSYDSLGGTVAYAYSTTTGDKGDITCNADLLGDVVSTGNAKVKGHLSAGPTAALRFGPNSVVGSAAWHTAGNKGVQSTWLRKDANVTLPDVQPPFTSGTGTVPTSQGSSKYYLNQPGNWEINGNCNLSSSDTMTVKADVTLWVHGDFTMAGKVSMTGTGFRMKIYVSGNMNFSGGWDKSIDPSDLILYGLPTCKKIDLSPSGGGFASLQAAVYAPQADITLNGNAQFMGSSVSSSMTMKGNTGYHYDENLGKLPIYRGYVITSWKEI